MTDVVSPGGRQGELRLLTSVLTGSTDAAAIVVGGESGIGKTWLVDTASAVAGQANVTVVRGWCLRLSETLPFLPFVDLLSQIGELDDGRFLESVLSECPAFVRTEIVRLMPQLKDAEEPRPAGEPNDGWRRQRLFDALRRLFVEVGQRRQTALLIEDVHWADATTLEFVDYLLSGGRTSRLRLVMTCRVEAAPQPQLAEWLDRLRRNAQVQWMDLAALTETETATQMEQLLGYRPPQPVVDEVYARSEGNPFFTEQLTAARSNGAEPPAGTALPPGLTALLLARTAQVAGLARELLVVLACAARPLAESALARLCDSDEAAVRAALRELVAKRLLRVADGDGGYLLRHALLAEAVRGDLLAGERRELHRRVAEQLAGGVGAGVASEVAAHFREADEPEHELRWRSLAATEAEDLFASTEASAHWRRIITLWDRVPGAETVSGLDLASAYVQAVAASERSGAVGIASGLAEQALARLAATSSPATAVTLYGWAGHFRRLESLQAGLDTLAVAIEIGESVPPSHDYVRALRYYARARADQGHPEDERPLMTKALRAAEQIGSRSLQQVLLGEHAWLAMAAGDVGEAFANLQRARQIVLEPADAGAEAGLAVIHTDMLLKLGELEQVIKVGLQAIERAERGGVSQFPLMLGVRWNVCESWIELGDIHAAATLIDPHTYDLPGPDTSVLHVLRADVDMRRGRLADAAAFWSKRPESFTIVDHELAFHETLRRLELQLWLGEVTLLPSDTLHVLERYCRSDSSAFSSPLFVLALHACADRAELARATGDAEGVQRAQADAARLSHQRRAAPVDPFGDGAVSATAAADYLSWQAEETRLEGRSDPEAWDHTAKAWDTARRPHRAAYARWRQAQALLASRHARAQATEALLTAVRQAEQHMPLSQAIGELARLARIQLRQPAAQSVSTSEPRPAMWGLTERELAVLQLLAQGKTNPEIGTTLFISTRTAGVHVGNILRKLGVATRVQAATIAERAGVLAE